MPRYGRRILFRLSDLIKSPVRAGSGRSDAAKVNVRDFKAAIPVSMPDCAAEFMQHNLKPENRNTEVTSNNTLMGLPHSSSTFDGSAVFSLVR